MLIVSTAAKAAWHGTNVTGAFADLAFTMTRSSDGKTVTAADYRGKVVVVYFGFTRCPDTCPLTMFNIARALRHMSPAAARKMAVLFVTIDLAYDTLPRLKAYMAKFGPAPQFDGLRGTPAELSTMAKRYDVSYTAPSNAASPDPVAAISHSAAVYAFDPRGRARLLLGMLGTKHPAIADAAADFTRLGSA
ncbi:MAG: SCO family protein [Acetobacteraceae bacterium]